MAVSGLPSGSKTGGSSDPAPAALDLPAGGFEGGGFGGYRGLIALRSSPPPNR